MPGQDVPRIQAVEGEVWRQPLGDGVDPIQPEEGGDEQEPDDEPRLPPEGSRS